MFRNLIRMLSCWSLRREKRCAEVGELICRTVENLYAGSSGGQVS